MQQQTALELKPQELLLPRLCSATLGGLPPIPWSSVSSCAQTGIGSVISDPPASGGHLMALHSASDKEGASPAEVRALSKRSREVVRNSPSSLSAPCSGLLYAWLPLTRRNVTTSRTEAGDALEIMSPDSAPDPREPLQCLPAPAYWTQLPI